MRKSRIRNSFVPIVYGAIVVVFLFGMYFAQKFAKSYAYDLCRILNISKKLFQRIYFLWLYWWGKWTREFYNLLRRYLYAK